MFLFYSFLKKKKWNSDNLILKYNYANNRSIYIQEPPILEIKNSILDNALDWNEGKICGIRINQDLFFFSMFLFYSNSNVLSNTGKEMEQRHLFHSFHCVTTISTNGGMVSMGILKSGRGPGLFFWLRGWCLLRKSHVESLWQRLCCMVWDIQ